MPALRLVRAEEPFEAHENVDLRRMLARLTLMTQITAEGGVLLACEAQALYEVLAHRTFSHGQLDEIERMIREVDPHKKHSMWNNRRLRSFFRVRRYTLDRPEWIDLPIQRLDAAMREQGKGATFRLWLTRAALTIFLTTSDPRTDRLAG